MKNTIQFLIILAFVAIPALLLAQPQAPSSGPGCFPPPCVPIDGGTTLLIAAGLAIGGKKAYDLRNKNE